MCWMIIYHEEKILVHEKRINYNDYKRVNVLENNKYIFQIERLIIQDRSYYDISYGQCACEFFNLKNKILLEEFKRFIYNRMEINCLEPYILVEWMNNDFDIKSIIKKLDNMEKINIQKEKLVEIFDRNKEGMYYCIKRE